MPLSPASKFTVKARIEKKGEKVTGKIMINSKNYHKVIPAVLFTPNESQAILEIVDQVEKDTIANIVYK